MILLIPQARILLVPWAMCESKPHGLDDNTCLINLITV